MYDIEIDNSIFDMNCDFGNDFTLDFDNEDFVFGISIEIDVEGRRYLKLESLTGKMLQDIINLKLEDIIYEGVITNG
ncbi:MAG: hypothetical protein ACRDD7_03565 [Peptostreptococcaceae bacterium]